MNKLSILLSLGLIILLVGIFMLVTGSITKYTGYFVHNDASEFNECLSRQDLRLYINSDKPSEALKSIDNSYLSYFDIINCKVSKDIECLNVIEPLWSINGMTIEGDIFEEDLVELSGC